MQNSLSLHISERGYLDDKFGPAFIRQLDLCMENDLIKALRGESLGSEEPYEKRFVMLEEARQDQYKSILSELTSNCSFFKSHHRRAKYADITDRGIKYIQMYLWIMEGNEIPIADLQDEKIAKFLRTELDYTYFKEKGMSGWYIGNNFIGKTWKEAFVDAEKKDSDLLRWDFL